MSSPPTARRDQVINAVLSGPEMKLPQSQRVKVRSALTASGLMAVILLPVGLLLGFLAHSFVWLVFFEAWAALLFCLSYFGQGRNEVFLGPGGIRRNFQGSDVTARWSELSKVQVRVPGNAIVVFTLEADQVDVERGRGGGRNYRMLIRHPPEGFDFRLDRQAADLLMDAIGQRRPGLPGLEEWPTASRPG